MQVGAEGWGVRGSSKRMSGSPAEVERLHGEEEAGIYGSFGGHYR